MEKISRIYVAGHRGLVGSALVRKLESDGYTNLILPERAALDLTRQVDVEEFFTREKPEYVFLAAAKVGGILANNTYRGQFIRENLVIQTNVIHSSYENNVRKLLFLGSSCIYPKNCPQPMKEVHLLDGKLEPTNQPYALAKIAGIEMCQAYNRQYGVNYISVMPTNVYGPNDNFDLNSCHALPALLSKTHEAKLKMERTSSDAYERGSVVVEIWGSGAPKREFLHVDDLADACVYLMDTYDGSDIVNVGTGTDLTIKELAYLIKDIVGYKGDFVFDSSKPDGTLRKLLDVSRLKELGWEYKISLKDGIKQTYDWYLKTYCQTS